MLERSDPVNWSTLKAMRTSPKHYRHALANPREDTDALLQGRVVHCAVYEPDALAQRYVVEPRFHKGMKDDTAIAKGYDGGKQAAATWLAENAGREVVPSDIWARSVAMAEALHADPLAAPMIVGGYAEQLITWTDAETGIECRGRVDHVNGCLSDLKTTRHTATRQFVAQAIRFGYHGQLAYYADGLAANGIALDGDPALIVVENAAPHDVYVLDVPPDQLEAGRALYRSCLDMLAQCRARDEWPGVAGGKRLTLSLPAWAMPREEEVELTMGGVPL